MIKKQISVFILRWFASSLGMFICITFYGTIDSVEVWSSPWILYIVAGLIFSVVNSVVKPLIKIMALPLAIFTLGVSTVLINTLMVIVTIHFLPGVEMSLLGAVFSSMVLSVINYTINLVIG